MKTYFRSSLKETDNVIQLLDGGKMKVNYSPYFITLIKEVRQLTAMGYIIPRNILEISEHAKKFSMHAKTLDQVSVNKSHALFVLYRYTAPNCLFLSIVF